VFLNTTDKSIPVHVHIKNDVYIFDMLGNAIATALV